MRCNEVELYLDTGRYGTGILSYANVNIFSSGHRAAGHQGFEGTVPYRYPVPRHLSRYGISTEDEKVLLVYRNVLVIKQTVSVPGTYRYLICFGTFIQTFYLKFGTVPNNCTVPPPW